MKKSASKKINKKKTRSKKKNEKKKKNKFWDVINDFVTEAVDCCIE
jgi:hypothetical protein